ncbi:zinc finger HIT domain-containing protein 2 [Rhinatrema bivittatum]|uniref:zinc finger HIT domain-containing protein 2 n=1 Tax=Rhinatrema bivittatum TaxID=194408 RepID=UPI00112A74C4|nr:zinc finger HIT domain-containing protein 2 [Rhinatrema bivittatum]
MEREEEAAAAACGLCLVAPGRYTCPRCNVRFCSLPCYRGASHRRCSEAFYRRAVLQELRRRCPPTDGTVQDILLRDWQSRAAPGVEEWLTGPQEEEEPGCLDTQGDILGYLEKEEDRQLWARLTPQEKEEFQQLLKNGGIGALVPEWRPWWERHETAQLVREIEEGVNGDRSPGPSREQRESGERRAGSFPNKLAGTLATAAPQVRGDGKEGGAHERAEHQGKSTEIAAPQKRRNGKKGPALETKAKGPPKSTSDALEMMGSPLKEQEAIPAIPAAIPPLSSLTHSPSPLVPFSVVNVLYAYAFSLKLYNGDLNEAFILQEFLDTVLGVSGVLNSKQVFHSTAEALQAGVQAVLSRRYTSDPQGPSEAMRSVIHILMGENKTSQKNYVLAALSHLTSLLRNAKKLAQKEAKKKIFEAQKKCEFLLVWANEHEDTLKLLSVEAHTEYKIHRDRLKEIEAITNELEKVWRGKKPPEKKLLIQELD